MFIVLLTSIGNAFNHTRCVSWSNQKCEIQPTFINLHPNEYNQELHNYPFAVKLDKYVGSGNSLNDLTNKVCVRDKREDLNAYVFNMITGKKWIKNLTKDISWEWKRKFHGRKCNSNQNWNNDKCWYECKKHHICEKVYIWIPAICSCKNGKHLASIIENSLITCGKVIKEIKAVSTNFNEKNIASKIQNFYILLVFLLLL